MSIGPVHEYSRNRWFEGVVYNAYGDESADETQQRVFAVAGLFGNKSDWNIFRKKWRDLTGGMIFHATECDSDQGVYADIDHRVNKKLYADLANLIANSRLIGCAVSVSLPDYKELVAPSLDDNPYYICFQSVIIHLATRSSLCLPRDHIKFTFDRNTRIEYNAGALYDRIINGKWGNAEFMRLMEDEIGFATRKTIGIQAADLVAREGMKLLDNRYGPNSRPTRVSTQVLQACKRIKFRLYDRGWCEKFIRESKIAQYPKSDYFEWLENHGLTHTLANKLKYEASIPRPPLLPSSLPPITF